ncbi:MAG: hypothetical protein HFE78_03415 [Clostridiales bacterium]|nr:hypothetical protein [Clostridiales bacterium]
MKQRKILLILLVCLLMAASVACRQAEPPTATSEETQPTQASEPATEPTAEPSDETQYPTGGTQFCPVHDYAYHGWEDEWVAYAGGEEELLKWIEQKTQQWEEEKKAGAESDCYYEGQNIKAFIDYFQIPRELFEETCNELWRSIHNIDLLYSDDLEAIEAYYRDMEKRDETRQKKSIFCFAKNSIIIKNVDVEQIYKTGTEEEKRRATAEWISIFELVEEYDVSRTELEQYLKESAKRWIDPVTYDYQFDVVYNEDGSVKPYDKTKPVVELDAMFCGVDNLFTD